MNRRIEDQAVIPVRGNEKLDASRRFGLRACMHHLDASWWVVSKFRNSTVGILNVVSIKYINKE